MPEPILSRLERDQFWEALIEKFPRQIENWSMEDGTEPGPRMTHGTSVLACVFSPDGSLIAGAGGGCLPGCDGSIRIWDSKTGKEEQVCRGHICGIYDLAFDPLTGILASASEDYSVVLWNLEQRDTISLAGGPPVVKGHVAFAGTVPRIAIGEVMCYEEEECCVYVIDLNTGMEIFRKLAGYDKPPTGSSSALPPVIRSSTRRRPLSYCVRWEQHRLKPAPKKPRQARFPACLSWRWSAYRFWPCCRRW